MLDLRSKIRPRGRGIEPSPLTATSSRPCGDQPHRSWRRYYSLRASPTGACTHHQRRGCGACAAAERATAAACFSSTASPVKPITFAWRSNSGTSKIVATHEPGQHLNGPASNMRSVGVVCTFIGTVRLYFRELRCCCSNDGQLCAWSYAATGWSSVAPGQMLRRSFSIHAQTAHLFKRFYCVNSSEQHTVNQSVNARGSGPFLRG